MKKGASSASEKNSFVSPQARSFLLIGVLSAIAIWVISNYSWSKLVQNAFPDGKWYSLTATNVPDAQDRTYLGEIVSRMGFLGRIAGLALFSWISNASSADPQDSFEFDCVALPYRLNDTNAPNTTISLSQYIPGGTVLDLSSMVNRTCLGTNAGPVSQKVSYDICRVAAYTKTSERSGIHYELWMPRSWSGRFISHGNGGLSGCIDYASLAYSSSNEFAAISANSGHNGTSGGAFFHNSDVVADFVWRSVHTGVLIGKAVTKTFYGKPHSKSYYLGCSTGGRQGFKSVQDFPDDFDGVVAGAPAFAFNNLTSWSGQFYKITGPPGSPTFIPALTWIGVVHRDILKQCDTLDGVEDGIIENPSACQYDPKNLECGPSPSSSNTTCLSKAQIETVKAVFAPLRQTDGSLIYPGLTIDVGYSLTFNGSPFPYTMDWFRYAIYQNASWDAATLSLEDMAYAHKLNPSNAETWSGDLNAFFNRGSKVIHYHGLSDPVISSENSKRYYEHVRSTMGLTYAAQDEFYRYFPISGTGHCGGGRGAWAIGQSQKAAASSRAQANVLSAIVQWVEQDIPPESLLGTKWVDDTRSKGIAFQRNHCKYPATNKYKGAATEARMDDPFNGSPRRSSKLYDNYQLYTLTSNESSFRTQRMRQSLPAMKAMFQSDPSQQDQDIDYMSSSYHELQTVTTNDPFQPEPYQMQDSMDSSLQLQPHRSQFLRNNSLQPQLYQHQIPMNNSFQTQPQPLRRANTEYYPGRQTIMHDPFEPEASQRPIFSPEFPPRLLTQRQPTESQNNPFWIPRAPQPPKEPMPTRHKRFKDSFSTIPENSATVSEDPSDVSESVVTCKECARNARVAREYWDRSKALEEEVSEQAEFIQKLKEQRKELELRVGELIGLVEGGRLG
ncbi:feruloyl esteras-like protein B [Venturia nashicola]|nr:feruloyl esteras-like protein B [Venturia nashicola]